MPETPQNGNAPPQEQSKSLVGQTLDAGKAAYGAVMKDGTIKAMLRQGADEVGQALKAFPESIQESELGTIFNPTPGEISKDRAANGQQPEQNQEMSRGGMGRGR